MKLENQNQKTENMFERIMSLNKYSLLPFSHKYQEAVKKYLSQYAKPSCFDFFQPYQYFIILTDILYFTNGSYDNPPQLVSEKDDLFSKLLLPIPEKSLKDTLFEGLIDCLKKWLKPWDKAECELAEKLSNSSLNHEIKYISEIKSSIINRNKVVSILKKYYIKNGIPFNLFHDNLFRLDNNIIYIDSEEIIRNIPSPIIHIFTTAKWLHHFDKKAEEYNQTIILSAYKALCKSLKEYPLNPYPVSKGQSSIILYNLLNDQNIFFKFVLNNEQLKLSKIIPLSNRFLYISMQNLNYDQQNIETIKNALTYLLQQNFTNLKFFSRLISDLYTEHHSPALYIIRQPKDEDFSKNYGTQLQQLFHLYDLTQVMKDCTFSPENLSDWYRHPYCAVFFTNKPNKCKEDFILDWVRGNMISRQNKYWGQISYKNTMPLIMSVSENQDISYLKTFLERRKVRLYELKLSSSVEPIPVIEKPICDYIRFLLLLGNKYHSEKGVKKDKASKSYSKNDVLKDFVTRFCTVDVKDAKPIFSKEFYHRFVVPYYNHLSIKPVGPTIFNRLMPELFPEQVACRKFHAKSQVEGQHIFHLAFHENKWKEFLDQEQKEQEVKPEEFQNELNELIAFSNGMIDSITGSESSLAPDAPSDPPCFKI